MHATAREATHESDTMPGGKRAGTSRLRRSGGPNVGEVDRSFEA